ncbi:MAG: helix-turn-helix domain-containing protein [Flavobacteriales bacterium]|nr:helix-turn-helix domain-containing protein [Flavobacteriales bacterium]
MKKGDKTPKQDDPYLALIGKRLKELRIEKGYSNYENVAYDNGINRMVVYRAEKGTNLTLNTLLKFLRIYEVSPSEFFASVEKMEE